jgi:Holliday junction resolvase RusA-like endonuclease
MPQIDYIFFGNVPSKKNGRRVIQRGSRPFSVPSVAYESWEKAHKAALKAKFKSPNLVGFQIEITPYFANNRLRDTDNLETSILDCLKAGGVIKDDRWQYHTGPPIVNQPQVDPVNPRVEIAISYGGTNSSGEGNRGVSMGIN